MQAQKLYDAFLSHNNNDKPAVRQIAQWLRDQAKLKVWFDKWNIRAGDVWQEEIEKALDQSRSCVVFLGSSGLGGWHNEEMRSAIEDRVAHKEMRVIPVLLPNTKIPEKESGLTRFLRRHSYVEFRHDINDAEALQRLARGIDGKQAGESASRLYETVCPFRGLEVFREEHAKFFFGRESVVQRLQHYLQDHRFLAVIGPSGSGKSSVVQAGLIPALKKSRGQRAEGIAQINSSSPSALRPPLYSLFTPQDDPIRELAIALRPLMTPPPLTSGVIIEALMKNEKQLEYIGRDICQNAGEAKLLLVIDQFEEVFTQTADEQKRQRFFDSLLNTVEAANSPTFIVLTMRSDFLGKCAAYADLNTFIIDHLFQIGPMSLKELHEAIEEPAQRVGLEFEKGLVEIILRDASGAPGELPLIEHALLELYERRSGNQLTQAAYEEIGGISGALAKRAEAEFARLTSAQQEILRKMFVLRLIQPGEGTEDTRRRATKEELLAAGGNAKEAEAVLQQWTNARLLTTTRDEEKKQEIVDVAHETLIRTWPKVQDWLKDERENTRLIGQLRQAAAEWQRAAESPDYLYTGAQLVRVEELQQHYAEDLTALEKRFIQAGIAQRERLLQEKAALVQKQAEQQRQSLRRTRVFATALAVLLVLAAGLAWQAIERGNAAKHRTLAANYNLARALEEKAERAVNEAPQPGKSGLYRQGWIYAATALQQETEPDSVAMTPAPAGALFDPGVIRNTFAEKWFSPAVELHHRSINSVAFSPDGKMLASASDDQTIRLWDMASGESRRELKGHIGAVNSVAFSPDGKMLASASDDQTIRQWDVASGESRRELKGQTYIVWSVAFSPDGKMLASASDDETIRLWDVASGEPRRELKGQTYIVGQRFIVRNVAFSPDGKMLASTSSDQTIRLWDVASGESRRELKGHTNYVKSVAFSPDGKMLASASDDQTIRLWDVASGESSAELKGQTSWVRSVAFSPDGKMLASASDDQTIRLWDVASGESRRELKGHINTVWSVTFSPDGKMLASASSDQTIRLWNVASGESRRELKGHTDIVWSVVFSPDGKMLASASSDQTIRLWDVASGESCRELKEHTDIVKSVAFSPDGKMLASGSYDKTIRLWDMTSGESRRELKGHTDIVRSVAFSPDGKMLASASDDGTIRLWDVASGELRRELKKHTNTVWSVVFSPDGKMLASASDDQTIRLWDAASGESCRELKGPSRAVKSMAFSPDGKMLASAGPDQTIRLWDVASGESRRELKGHTYTVWSVVFSPDGKMLASGSYDKTIRLWDVSFDQLYYLYGKHQPLWQKFSEAIQFLWGVKLIKLQIQPAPRVPTLYDQDGYYFVYDKKFRPLLNPPLKGIRVKLRNQSN